MLAERLEYCETWGWKQGVRMQWQLKCGVLEWHSFAMVLASPRARGCRPALPLGKAAGTTFPRKGRSLCLSQILVKLGCRF